MTEDEKAAGDAADGHREKTKVTLDPSVIISDVAFGSEGAKEAVRKSTTEDMMMFTEVIYDECMKFPDKRKNKTGITKEYMDKELKERFDEPIGMVLPPDEELYEIYWVRDKNDYKILYSAHHTGSRILVTRDGDFFDPKLKVPEGLKIVEMYAYIGKEGPQKKNR